MIVVALETARLGRGRTSTMAFLAILNAWEQNVRCFLARLGARVAFGARQKFVRIVVEFCVFEPARCDVRRCDNR